MAGGDKVVQVAVAGEVDAFGARVVGREFRVRVLPGILLVQRKPRPYFVNVIEGYIDVAWPLGSSRTVRDQRLARAVSQATVLELRRVAAA